MPMPHRHSCMEKNISTRTQEERKKEMNTYTYTLIDDHKTIRVIAEDETSAQHKLLQNTIGAVPITTVGKFMLIHTEEETK